MTIAARKLDTCKPDLEYGTVVSGGETGIEIETECGSLTAKQALTCLIRPVAGDRVLLSLDLSGTCYVLAVLERPETTGTALDFNGDVELNVHEGTLNVRADRDLSLAARREMDFTSGELSVYAGQGQINVNDLSFLGRVIEVQIQKMKVTAQTCDQFFRRLTQRLFSSFRAVEEHDEIQAGSARYLVDGTLTMQSRNAVHIAEEDVKVDAEQIHLG